MTDRLSQVYLGFLTMQGFFRTFGIMCSNFDTAFRLATFFIPNMIQYAGYMIPVQQMKRWLFWIYYINPVAYGACRHDIVSAMHLTTPHPAFVGALENEFMRVDVSFPSSTRPHQKGSRIACTSLPATATLLYPATLQV